MMNKLGFLENNYIVNKTRDKIMKILLAILLILTALPAYSADTHIFTTNATGTPTANLDADGSTNYVRYDFQSGHSVVAVEGTWDGATVTPYFFTADSSGFCSGFETAQVIAGAEMTSASPSVEVFIGGSTCVGVTVSSSGASTDVIVRLKEVTR